MTVHDDELVQLVNLRELINIVLTKLRRRMRTVQARERKRRLRTQKQREKNGELSSTQ
jgi:hypothetical protein